jgi:hypothetical protein
MPTKPQPYSAHSMPEEAAMPIPIRFAGLELRFLQDG